MGSSPIISSRFQVAAVESHGLRRLLCFWGSSLALTLLFRQICRSGDVEWEVYTQLRGLSSSYEELIFARANGPRAFGGDVAKLAGVDFDVDRLAGSASQVDLPEADEGAPRGSGEPYRDEVKFSDFIAIALA